jgi:hypothetical protein
VRHTTEVEDLEVMVRQCHVTLNMMKTHHPENTDEATLLGLRPGRVMSAWHQHTGMCRHIRVGKHETTLRRPEQASANTEDCTSSDDKGARARVNVHGPEVVVSLP